MLSHGRMYVRSFTSLWRNCSNVFIRTSQGVFGGVEPGENFIGIFIVGFLLLLGWVFLIPRTHSVMLPVVQ